MSNSSADPPADYEDDREEEARAVDALAMRLQPMLAEGRTAEVQSILLKALTCPEMRQRALSLLDYLTSEGAIFSVQNRQQVRFIECHRIHYIFIYAYFRYDKY